MDPLTRYRFQDPQTSMERHVSKLVASLRDGIYTRAEFASMIEDAMAHAFWLETRCTELSAENRKLEDALAVGLPTVSARWAEEDMPYSIEPQKRIEWRMDPIMWRAQLHPFQAQASHTWWLRIRRSSYRKMLKLFREQFDKTFPKIPFTQ